MCMRRHAVKHERSPALSAYSTIPRPTLEGRDDRKGLSVWREYNTPDSLATANHPSLQSLQSLVAGVVVRFRCVCGGLQTSRAELYLAALNCGLYETRATRHCRLSSQRRATNIVLYAAGIGHRA